MLRRGSFGREVGGGKRFSVAKLLLLLWWGFDFAAVFMFFCTEILRRERKVLCMGRGAGFEIGTRLFFGSLLKRLRGGRLLFPLRRKK
jgi:hypothetical protein